MTDPQSFNRYTYVQNDPVNFVDPTGLQEVIVGPCPAGQCVVTVYGSVGGLFGGGGGSLGSTLHPPLLDGPELSPDGGGGGGGGAPAPPQTRGSISKSSQRTSCDARLTGDRNVDLLARYLYGENAAASIEEYKAIGQLFLNRFRANVSWLGGQNWERVLSFGSLAEGTLPFRQAGSNDSLSRMDQAACAAYKRAQEAARYVLRDNPNYELPGGSILPGADFLWFVHHATTSAETPGVVVIGTATFFNYDPRYGPGVRTGAHVLSGEWRRWRRGGGL